MSDTGRYGVTHHHDDKGVWYSVIDKHAKSSDNTVLVTRNRDKAHEHAMKLNDGN